MPEDNGFHFFLVLIDLFSSFLYTKALKTKGALDVKHAFQAIISDNSLEKMTTIGTGKS
jgi:hypothetical protein